ncbi:MAG: FAD-dependent oxidoreductase, partial [Acidimicrobiales bacterium]
FSNKRTDSYGGSFENRLRLPLEVMEAVRAQVGEDFAVGIRVSADEFVAGGLEPAETSAQVDYLLDRQRIDYISVSQSNYVSIDTMIPDMSYPRAPFAHYAKEIRQVARGVPVFAVARLVTPEQCEELLETQVADAVCLVRPLIADPELPNKSRDGRRQDVRECISCNVGCRGGPHRGSPIACLVNPVVGYEAQWGIGKVQPAATSRRVLVVGGGPGGLKAAETAAIRGHDVTLVEGAETLGGQVLVAAAAMPYRDEFANSVRFLERQLDQLGVSVILGQRADTEFIDGHSPEAIVVATGSRPGRPDIPGAEEATVYTPHDVVAGQLGKAGRVIVIDSGEADWKCLTTAERLGEDGNNVTIITPVPIGAEMDTFSKPPMLRRLRAAGVDWIEYHGATAIEPGRVQIREGFTGDLQWLNADAVVAAWYGEAEDSLLAELRNRPGLDVRGVGDCIAPRRAIDAIWDGFRVGMDL